MGLLRLVVLASLTLGPTQMILSQSETVIFSEPGFPVADSTPISNTSLERGFVGATRVNTTHLANALDDARTQLLVMPYGSAYPEAAWPALLRYLDRGGNLIVLGGKPFTRAAYQSGGTWRLRAPSVAASLELFIQNYQQTPGSQSLQFLPNPDVQPELPRFQWTRAFSPTIRLSVISMPHSSGDIGAAGSEDATLTTLAWGTKEEHRLAAPALLIDHIHNRFVGGRWIFLACDPEPGSFDSTDLLGKLQKLALRKNDSFTLRPRMALFLPGESLDFNYKAVRALAPSPGDELRLTVHADEGPTQTFHFNAMEHGAITLPASASEGTGLHTVVATLWRNGMPLSRYRTGFWMRDWAYLQSGPKLSVDSDYFQLDGKPMPVVGTTYMGSDANREFLEEPNPYLWNEDLHQIHATGMTMVRTGIWSGWKQLVNPDDSMRESSLRAIEALLMTARRNHLAVQFNLFAFLPDAFGGTNAYLDPIARQMQDRYVFSVVHRFHDVPFLAWDLINEPSANANLWKTLPERDSFEKKAWRKWVHERYPDQAALLAAWAEPSFGVGRTLQSSPTNVPPEVAAADPLAMPVAGAFEAGGVRSGANPLKVYDYYLFTQNVFLDWVRHQRDTIHAASSEQLVTVGEDEGGISNRLSPAFYSPLISFTTTHTWWDFDSVLWAALAAKMPGEPMLIQEMGEQRRLEQDARSHFTPQEEAWQLERKLAISFAQGAGGLEWVWNVDATMANDNETPIGAIRPDGTEKPEAEVLAGFAQMVQRDSRRFQGIEAPSVTIVTSQAFTYSGMISLAAATQKKALRALVYYDHIPARMLPENRLAELGTPKLVLLPAAQALTDTAWQQLLKYVANGGNLLITGPLRYNEHWQKSDRLTELGIKAHIFPIAVRQSTFRILGEKQEFQVTFPADVQQAPTDTMRFTDGRSIQIVPYHAGKIIWVADPVEFSDGYTATAALYSYAAQLAGVTLPFRELKPLSPGVLVFPTMLKDAILYSFSSESLDDQTIDIEDSATKATIAFTLPAQRGAMVLLSRSDGSVLASYGVVQK
jgi:hypothetical protein